METTSPTERNAVRRAFGGGIQALDAAADAVEELMAHKGWTILMELLESESQTILGSLDKPLPAEPPTHAQFVRAHGYADGIFAVKRHAAAVLERRARVMAQQRAKHEEQAASAGSDGGGD